MERDRGKLVLVGTPIGNREDFSPRARREVLSADLLLCEDTRSPLRLFEESERERLPRRMSCFVGNEHDRVSVLLEHLERGETVVFVSEAGMPVWSDPGHLLVRAAIDAGHLVDVIPGPTAATVALAHAGLEARGTTFLGFVARQGSERARALALVGQSAGPVILYEAGNRLGVLLDDLVEFVGERAVTVGRELTKRHQEIMHGTAAELRRALDASAVRGEVTVVIEGVGSDAPERDPAREAACAVWNAVTDLSLKPRERARRIAEQTGLDGRELYRQLSTLHRRDSGPTSDEP